LSSAKKILPKEEKLEQVNLSEDIVQEDYNSHGWSSLLGYFTAGMIVSGILFAIVADAQFDTGWYILIISSFIGWLILRVLDK
jgi:hypothetical protein